MREAVVWSPQLSTGVQAMDDEHRRLLDIINELDQAMRSGQGKAVLEDVFSRLFRYAREHFAHEERLMLRAGVEGLREHVAAHQAFVARAESLKDEWHAGRLAVPVKVLDFLRDWLVAHIQTVDKGYGPAMKAHLAAHREA